MANVTVYHISGRLANTSEPSGGGGKGEGGEGAKQTLIEDGCNHSA